MTATAVTPLTRSMRRAGNLLITISAITPAASVFIMGQDVIHQAGTGAILCFAAAALLGLTTAFVYAELSSAFPLTGGEYSMIGRTMGPSWGFMALGLNLFGGALGQAVTALGLADYLGVVAPGIPALPVAVAVTAATTLVTVLNIRLNAKITGVFLLVELAALGMITALGRGRTRTCSFIEATLHPVMLSGAALVHTPWAVIGVGTAGAVYAYNGYGGAVYFGEEMYEARTKVAWVIFVSLAVVVLAEFIPIAAAIVGAADLKAMLGAHKPLPTFLLASGGELIDKAVSFGVAFAIINAMIAIGLINARQLYCSGRDGVWPGPVNRWVAAVHPRFNSPWVATLVMGVATAACCLLPLELLIMLTGTGLVMIYAGVSVAAIAGRINRTTDVGHYRMPLYPLWPALSLLMLVGVAWAEVIDPEEGRPSLIANVVVMALSAAYYLLYLRRRGGWTLRGADGTPLEAEGLGS